MVYTIEDKDLKHLGSSGIILFPLSGIHNIIYDYIYSKIVMPGRHVLIDRSTLLCSNTANVVVRNPDLLTRMSNKIYILNRAYTEVAIPVHFSVEVQ